MDAIHTLVCGYTIDLSKIQIVSSVHNNEFSIIMDYDGSMTYYGDNNEGIDLETVHTELLQAWKEYNNEDKTDF